MEPTASPKDYPGVNDIAIQQAQAAEKVVAIDTKMNFAVAMG